MAIHIDTDGNFYFGASGSTDFASINYTPVFSVTKDGVLTASSGTVGGIDLATDYIQSSNYSAVSGSEAGFRINSNGNAEFNNVTIRGDLFGVELKGQMVFDSNGNGSIKTSTSGTRVEILDNSGIEGEIRFETSTGTTARLVADAATEFTIEQSALSGGKIKLVTGVTSDGLQFTGNEINITTPLSSGNPVIKLNGTNANSAGTSTLSKLLGVTSSGRLAVGSATSGVVSISGSGDIAVTGSSGVLNIHHDDSDHSFANSSHNHTESDISDIGSHSHSNLDNYEKWILKGNGNNLNVLPGYGVEFKAGSGISLSVNTSPYEITFSHGGGTHVSSSTAVQAIFVDGNGLRGSVSFTDGTGGKFWNGFSNPTGNTVQPDTTSTFNGTPTFSSINVNGNIQHSQSLDGSGLIGFSTNRFNRLYASNGVSTTSDERLKENIENIPYGLDYLNTLRPVQFEWIPKTQNVCSICDCVVLEGNDNCGNCWENVLDEDGLTTEKINCACEIISVDITGNKKLWGFIAQELIDTPPEPDIDIELVDYDSEGDAYNMNYSQLIAPLVKAVQELSTQISDLTARVEALEG
jgi:hypothetical protein